MGRSKRTRLGGYARRMRTTPTTSEAILWEWLKGSQVGVAFRRQVVIGRYIVDFCAPSVRLVVEVDGGYHGARSRADRRRDRELERLGYTVLRLSAAVVIGDTEQAVRAVRRVAGQG